MRVAVLVVALLVLFAIVVDSAPHQPRFKDLHGRRNRQPPPKATADLIQRFQKVQITPATISQLVGAFKPTDLPEDPAPSPADLGYVNAKLNRGPEPKDRKAFDDFKRSAEELFRKAWGAAPKPAARPARAPPAPGIQQVAAASLVESRASAGTTWCPPDIIAWLWAHARANMPAGATQATQYATAFWISSPAPNVFNIAMQSPPILAAQPAHSEAQLEQLGWLYNPLMIPANVHTVVLFTTYSPCTERTDGGEPCVDVIARARAILALVGIDLQVVFNSRWTQYGKFKWIDPTGGGGGSWDKFNGNPGLGGGWGSNFGLHQVNKGNYNTNGVSWMQTF